MTTIGVLALQGDVREHARALSRAGAASITKVRYPADLAQVTGLVIPGGESTTIIKLLQQQELLAPIQALIASGFPVYGSCAGLILLANQLEDGMTDQETLGGIDMTVRRNAFGRQVASFEQAVTISAIGEDPIPGIFIRAPWITSVGDEVEILGSVSDHEGTQRIVAVRSGNLLATSFHPELTADFRIHKYFIDSLVRPAVQ